MASSSPVVQQNATTKAKRPIPPGIQTNGTLPPTLSPSPSLSAKKPSSVAIQMPSSAGERSITASAVCPVHRARRETSLQSPSRNSKNSGGIHSISIPEGVSAPEAGPLPCVPDSMILKKFSGRIPSLIVHMHPNHFRFDGQDGMFPYNSPMRVFIEHLRARTIPHDLMEYFNQAAVPFYDGNLIVQVHCHKPLTDTKKITQKSSAKSSSKTNSLSSIHNYNQCLTPSPYVPFPKEEQAVAKQLNRLELSLKSKEENARNGDKACSKEKSVLRPKITTIVLRPTSESLHADLIIKATTPREVGDGRADALTLAQPSTPMSLMPPTPTISSMPPPAKRVKKEKMELERNDIYAAEGQILLTTAPPLVLEPTKSVEETIALLEVMSHPKHSESPPKPMTRKRTVAEMAADEAAAAEQERYMLVLDERLSANVAGTQGSGSADGDNQTGVANRFARFKALDDIRRDLAERKEQEQIKQQEIDRRAQLQRQQEMLQRQQAEAEKARREAAAARDNQIRQAEAQRQAAAAQSHASHKAATAKNPNNAGPQQHTHPLQNGMPPGGISNGVIAAGKNAMANGIQGQAQTRFPNQIVQPPASSPVIRHGTPQQQNMSSPMVGSVPMQKTNSSMAASPPRPASVVQNAQISVPMAHNISARGSQQSHPSGTPRMPHSTPNMAHGTPINRPAAMSATPRMSQASPPPNMMAQNSQMGQPMMKNSQSMNQHNPQVYAQMAAQQRIIAQQQQIAAAQNGANMGLNGQGMTAQQHQMAQIAQRQLLMQQQQQQQQQQGGMMTSQQQQQFSQYAQQLQNMQGGQLRQMLPHVQAQLQQMMRMGQIGNSMQRQASSQMMNNGNANMQALLAMQQQQQQQQQQHQHQHQHQQQQQPHQQSQHQQNQQQKQQHQHHQPHHQQAHLKQTHLQQAQLQQAQQHQQDQQHQQAQKHQQAQQHQPQQPGQAPQAGAGPIHLQIQNQAQRVYHRLLQGAIGSHGGLEHIPPEALEKLKQRAYAQAQTILQQSMMHRRVQQQTWMQQQRQQQHQQQLQQQPQQQQQQQQQAAMQGIQNMPGMQGMMGS